MKVKLPIFRAGQYVRLRDEVGLTRMAQLTAGWRRMSEAEKNEWYDQHRKDVAEGKALPYDSAGEPVLSPQDVYIKVHPDRVYEIVRGRVSAARGYCNVSGSCLVRCLLTGEEFYIQRRQLVHVR